VDSLITAGALAGAIKFFKDKFDPIRPGFPTSVQVGRFVARQSFNLT
jgi:hypothetical protein